MLAKQRAEAQQKLNDTADKAIKAAGGVSTAMAVLAVVSIAALAIATVAIALAVKRA